MAGPEIDWAWLAGAGGAVKRVWSAKPPDAAGQEALVCGDHALEKTGSIATGCPGRIGPPAGRAGRSSAGAPYCATKKGSSRTITSMLPV